MCMKAKFDKEMVVIVMHMEHIQLITVIFTTKHANISVCSYKCNIYKI